MSLRRRGATGVATRCAVPTALLLCVLLRCATAEAHGQSMDMAPDLDDWRLTVGPQLSWGWDELRGNAALPGIDLTITKSLFWASVGCRALLQAEGEAWLPYLEAGAWLGANVGVGYDLVWTPGIGTDHGFHIFGGFPIPFGDVLEGDGFFLEPYTRLTFLWGDRDALFLPEAGLLLKYSFRLTGE